MAFEPTIKTPHEDVGPDWRSLTDAELGVAFRGGQEGSLEEAFRRFARLVNTFAWRLLGVQAEAEDVTQQVFVSAWRNRASFTPEFGTLPAWLLGIARNRSIDRQRSGVRDLRLTRAAAGDLASQSETEPPDVIIDRLLLADEIARLPDPRRSILTLSFYEGYSHAEISARLELPLGTVKSHARRALLILRGRLSS